MTSYGKTSLCSAESGIGCSDKEKAYIEKMKSTGGVKQTEQLARLSVRLLRITVSLVQSNTWTVKSTPDPALTEVLAS